jgi:hypothetical protein
LTPTTVDGGDSDAASVATSSHEQESTTAVESEAASESTDNDSTEGAKSGAPDDAKATAGDQAGKTAKQMIGKINNLVTSDLASIASVCQFSQMGKGGYRRLSIESER